MTANSRTALPSVMCTSQSATAASAAPMTKVALMTMPVIVIAARNAVQAVPPSIRDAALAVGASPVQATFHHVLPLALPGILTGTIIGMARALGETAPLLLSDDAFFKANGLLLRNTAAVNTLDGCGISLPCHAPGELPVGLMAWHGAMHDDTILQLALLIEPLLQFD